MGKPVQIVALSVPRQGWVRVEIDRSITGMAHESFDSAPGSGCEKPAEVVARNLFETGLVRRVHVFANVITIALVSGAKLAFHDASGSIMDSEELDKLREAIAELFVHYRPGVEPSPV